MDDHREFIVAPGKRVRLAKVDPSYTCKHASHKKALQVIRNDVARMDKLQYLLHADGKQSLLIVLQAREAGGKGGVVRHVFAGMNPQGTSVTCFRRPTRAEATHDFLWRAGPSAPLPRGSIDNCRCSAGRARGAAFERTRDKPRRKTHEQPEARQPPTVRSTPGGR
jgi:polyphosphate kinase 2 (PPK2 family)